MSKIATLMQQAAAGAVGEALAIEDVFSTYLYTGNGSTQTITNGIALGDFGVGTSTEFDGSSDYLSRLTDLTGATDSKTFTFSMWVYRTHANGDSSGKIVELTDSIRFFFTSTYFYVLGSNSSGSTAVFLRCSENLFPLQSWSHVVVSVDTASSSANIYVNDTLATLVTNTINNLTIDFTRSSNTYWAVGCQLNTNQTTVSFFRGRLAHVYLDYTYRDLSVEANRRIFIDANGGSTSPSTLSALNPILYLPMTEAHDIGENAGTGGNFTPNGSPTIIQSGTQFVEGFGEGGLVWTKARNVATYHALTDTDRGGQYTLYSPTTDAQVDRGNDFITSFNSDGYSIGADGLINDTYTYASWTFRKAPRFFDVVTYTGNGTAGRTIAHNLGVVPGCIIVKQTNTSGSSWAVYHRGTDSSSPQNYHLELDNTNARDGTGNRWNNTAPTSTVFSVGSATAVNANGSTYVAYLFAHDPLGPSGDGSDGLIACGSVPASAETTEDLGWEPQWLLIKRTDSTGDWQLFDNMRGFFVGGPDNARLRPNLSNAEDGSNSTFLQPRPTGFYINTNYFGGGPYIYIAIRRGPMRQPTSGTEVFATGLYTGNGTNNRILSNSITADSVFTFYRGAGFGKYVYDRLRGNEYWLNASATSAESRILGGSTERGYNLTKHQTDLQLGSDDANWFNINGDPYGFWSFRRAPGFFDVVCFTVSGSAPLAHNLTVAPEMVIYKTRGSTDSWWVCVNRTGVGQINSTGAWVLTGSGNGLTNIAQVTSTTFSNLNGLLLSPGNTVVAYLFATLPGVSKVGSISHTYGTDTSVDCGFTSGARFVLIKKTDTARGWHVFDTARGIVAGNDPLLELGGIEAEASNIDLIDPLSSGFSFTGNNPTGSYIFLAIA
jgi:hypothetical protein